MRKNKISYYLDISESVASRSTCIKKKYGAVIVKNDEIISTGYNGSPRGLSNCCELGTCFRLENNIKRGTRYEECRAVHAEMNAIISASRKEMIGSTLYLSGVYTDSKKYVKDCKPCKICLNLIRNSGIKKVICRLSGGRYKLISIAKGRVDVNEIF